VGVIQREIEGSGIATASISLVRRFTQLVRPPRALWVPFPFGRPLGAPRNVAVQRLVLLSTLELLKRLEGPVLEDLILPPQFEHLDAKYQTIGRKCSLTGCDLTPAVTGENTEESISDEPLRYDGAFDLVRDEIVALGASHRRYREQYRRTQVGASGGTPETILDAALTIHRFVCAKKGLEAETADTLQLPEARLIRSAIDDLKAFYIEARLAQDELGFEDASAVNDWLWLNTRMGRLLIAARDRLIEVTDRKQDPNWILARGIVPRGYGKSGYTMTHIVADGDY
jgi:hypothetical protein